MSVLPLDASVFLGMLPDKSVDLILTDPPYFGIVEDSWDNQWSSVAQFVGWLAGVLRAGRRVLKDNGSLLFFGGIGKHKLHPFFDVLQSLEDTYAFRNLLTWKKRRAYGKSHDYLFCREEIAWLSASAERTSVTFNIPLLDEKRGYQGWDPKHPAKSEFKRVSNVWTDDLERSLSDDASPVLDIPELMRPERTAQKPIPLMDRLIRTHSNTGDLVVDPFAGWGSTGVSAVRLGRRFLGAEAIEADAVLADERVRRASV